jgi:hypothetical protein
MTRPSGSRAAPAPRHRARLLGALAALALPLLGAAPSVAATGDYTYMVCANPDTHVATGGGVPSGFSMRTSDFRWIMTASCGTAGQPLASGQAVNMSVGSGANYAEGTYGSISYRTPAGITLLGGSYYRSLFTSFANGYGNLDINQQGSGNPSLVYGLPTNGGDSGDWYHGGDTLQRGSLTDPWAPANRVASIAHFPGGFDITAFCNPNGGNAGMCTLNSAHFQYHLYAAKLALHDAGDPAVNDSSGSLRAAYTLKGPETIAVNGSDSGAGVYRMRVLVDDVVKAMPLVSDNAGKCADVDPTNADPYEFASDQPCKQTAAGSFDFDTTTVPDGPHTLALQLEDAAGNTAPIGAPRTVLVANNPPVNTGAPTWKSQEVAQPRQGSALSIDNGVWSGPNLNYAYQWYRCDEEGGNCVAIPLATATTYTLKPQDLGHRIKVGVTASNLAGSVTAFGPLTGTVLAQQSNVTGPQPKPTPAPPAPLYGTPAPPRDAAHVFNGVIAGVPAGSGCPADEATLKVSGVSNGQVKLTFGKAKKLAVTLACTADGKAIGNATINVATRVGSKPATASTITTNSHGQAVLPLTKGSSRAITLAYRLYADEAIARAQAVVQVRVSAHVSLKPNHARVRNGHAVTLSGKLAGGLVPKRGVVLMLQWRDGARWRTFTQLRSNRQGAYRFRYRFKRTFRPTTYTFRVQVGSGQVDYPYVASASNRVKVRVAP